eukprot:sb/3478601/
MEFFSWEPNIRFSRLLHPGIYAERTAPNLMKLGQNSVWCLIRSEKIFFRPMGGNEIRRGRQLHDVTFILINAKRLQKLSLSSYGANSDQIRKYLSLIG